jgi:uncharacterized protein with PQ loop repeat
MNFNFLDKNVSITTNVFLVIANIINIWYNIPQVIKTYKCKSTRDFSSLFLFLRVIGNSIWIGYAIEVDSFQMLLNNVVTVLCSIFICYYKVNEIISDYQNKKIEKQNSIINNEENNFNEIIELEDKQIELNKLIN